MAQHSRRKWMIASIQTPSLPHTVSVKSLHYVIGFYPPALGSGYERMVVNQFILIDQCRATIVHPFLCDQAFYSLPLLSEGLCLTSEVWDIHTLKLDKSISDCMSEVTLSTSCMGCACIYGHLQEFWIMCLVGKVKIADWDLFPKKMSLAVSVSILHRKWCAA